MVYLAKKADTIEKARQMLLEAIQTGKALEKMKIFISSQGGDIGAIDHPRNLPQAKFIFNCLQKNRLDK